MKKIKINEKFFEIFPTSKIGILIANNLNNNYDGNEIAYTNMLKNSMNEAKKHLEVEVFSDNPIIKNWREAYSKIVTKKGARCSIEALLKRVNNGNEINNINPLVDIYNAISLKYGLPCGGEDLDKIVGDFELTFANGDEFFQTYGSEEVDLPRKNELIYKDDEGAICRSWNWREALRTILTTETKNAILVIEINDSKYEKELISALKEMKHLIETQLKGQVQEYIFDINFQEAEI